MEGLITVVLAAGAPWLLPDNPDTCGFLTAEEKAIVAHRLRYDTGTESGSVDANEGFKKKYVWAALLDYKVWLVVLVYWGSAIPMYGYVVATYCTILAPVRR